jgi:hypothetical protein
MHDTARLSRTDWQPLTVAFRLGSHDLGVRLKDAGCGRSVAASNRRCHRMTSQHDRQEEWAMRPVRSRGKVLPCKFHGKRRQRLFGNRGMRWSPLLCTPNMGGAKHHYCFPLPPPCCSTRPNRPTACSDRACKDPNLCLRREASAACCCPRCAY